MRQRRRTDDRSIRVASPQPSAWEYVYMLGRRVFTFCPRQGWVCATLGTTSDWEREYIRSLGRAFDTPAEVNAYAAAHRWPNWKPLSE